MIYYSRPIAYVHLSYSVGTPGPCYDFASSDKVFATDFGVPYPNLSLKLLLDLTDLEIYDLLVDRMDAYFSILTSLTGGMLYGMGSMSIKNIT